jgi:glucokinase
MSDKPALAIDIGGSTVKIALVAQDGELSGLVKIATESPDGHTLVDRIEHALRTSDVLASHRGPIGISVAGFVDSTRERMIYNPNLPWLEGFPLRNAVADRFDREVIMDADSNTACVAEYRIGEGAGSSRFLCIAIGTGVGGGMIVNDEVVRLAYGGLGDIGHVNVDPFGPECTAGCRGCAEAVIAAPAIEAKGMGTVAEIVQRAHWGDDRAKAVLDETGRRLGIAMATWAVMLFPDVIAIAGGVSEAGELLLAPARESFELHCGPFYRKHLRVAKAKLGWQASLVGAGLMAIAGS